MTRDQAFATVYYRLLFDRGVLGEGHPDSYWTVRTPAMNRLLDMKLAHPWRVVPQWKV